MDPLPDEKYYDPDSMKPEAREVFYKLYGTQREKQVVFNMEEELLKYCRSDGDILRRCCLNFAKTVEGLCKIDPFEHCIPSLPCDFPHHVFEEGNHRYHYARGVPEESQAVCRGLSLDVVCGTPTRFLHSTWSQWFTVTSSPSHFVPCHFVPKFG